MSGKKQRKRQRKAPAKTRQRDIRGLESRHDGHQYGFWVVAFLDLLGYQSLLKEMDVEPAKLGASPSLDAAAVRAVWVRRRLNLFIQEVLRGRDRVASFAHPPMILSTPGPDHIVLASFLAGPGPLSMLQATRDILVTAASAVLEQLRHGALDESDTLPLRGGIDFGLGILVKGHDFVVSPAMARAYQLENEAKYARILIGGRIHGLLAQVNDFVTAHPDRQMEQRLAEDIRGMVHTDEYDGRDVLDFFGNQIRALHTAADAKEVATAAWQYTTSMDAKFRESKQEEIAQKYRWLVDYMRPRLALWGVTS